MAKAPAKSLRFSYTEIPSMRVVPGKVNLRWTASHDTSVGLEVAGTEVTRVLANSYGLRSALNNVVRELGYAGSLAVRQANAAWVGAGVMLVRPSPAGHRHPIIRRGLFPWRDGSLRYDTVNFVGSDELPSNRFMTNPLGLGPMDTSPASPVMTSSGTFTAKMPRPLAQFTFFSGRGDGVTEIVYAWLNDIEQLTGCSVLFLDAPTMTAILQAVEQFHEYHRGGDSKRDKLEKELRNYGRRERLPMPETIPYGVGRPNEEVDSGMTQLRAQASWFPDSGSRAILIEADFSEPAVSAETRRAHGMPYKELHDYADIRRRLASGNVGAHFAPLFTAAADAFDEVVTARRFTQPDFPLVVMASGLNREFPVIVTRDQSPRAVRFRFDPHPSAYFAPKPYEMLTLKELTDSAQPAIMKEPLIVLMPGEREKILVAHDARLERGLRGLR